MSTPTKLHELVWAPSEPLLELWECQELLPCAAGPEDADPGQSRAEQTGMGFVHGE